MRPLYWLAGARWEALRECDTTERERVAVIGSTVLIPTTMAFLGMLFYSRSRFADPPWAACAAISAAWAFVIMNTDRILLATYRPFQPWHRRFMQVIFRFALAAVVSVAIAFPFCLDQFRPAIQHRYQTEYQQLLGTLREDESRIQSRNGQANFALLRKLALSLLKRHPGKESIGRKRLAAAYDTEFLEEILSPAAKLEKA